MHVHLEFNQYKANYNIHKLTVQKLRNYENPIDYIQTIPNHTEHNFELILLHSTNISKLPAFIPVKVNLSSVL